MVILEEHFKDEGRLSKKNESLTKKLNAIASRTGYQIIQTNGQRVYAPPVSRNVIPPPKGCEIFIGKLTKYIYEDELIPLFERIGPLYKFRMMLDFTEKTRGYAFATYFNPKHADEAIVRLNGYELRPKLAIGVYKSVDNCRLFVGNVPLDMSQEDILTELRQFAQGIINVIMFQDPQNPRLNRGFVFVEFESHRFAAMARRQFTPNNLVIWDKTLYVDWADPLPAVDPNVMSQVTILYLSNLPIDYNSDEIKACISQYISSQLIKKVHKNLTFAFVHLNNRSSAEFAFAKLQGFCIRNNKIGVEWARPRQYSKKYRWINPPENFCISVSPSLRKLVYKQKNSRFGKSSLTNSHTSLNSTLLNAFGTKRTSILNKSCTTSDDTCTESEQIFTNSASSSSYFHY